MKRNNKPHHIISTHTENGYYKTTQNHGEIKNNTMGKKPPLESHKPRQREQIAAILIHIHVVANMQEFSWRMALRIRTHVK